MSHKIFISILGTSPYLETKYYFGDKPNGKEKALRFVQEASISNTCKNWTKEDKVRVFLTKDAESSNWVDKGNREPYEGLQTRLNSLAYNFDLKAISIKDGFSETEIWDIFTTVFNEIDENVEIYFDITHAFRSIPMLVMVLINYAKFLKNVKVKGVYYGVFEKLGPAFKVKEMPVSERFAPIIDLSAFSELQDWTSAANEFLNFGSAEKIASLSENRINKLTKKQKNKLKSFPVSLKKYSKLFSTIRGKDIIDGQQILELNNKIDDFSEISKIKALDAILKRVKESTIQFEKKSINNGIVAIDWCIEHNLIQQAITLTQEMTITYLCDFWAKKYGLEYDKKIYREMLSSLFGVHNNNKIRAWTGSLKDLMDIAIQIKDEVLFVELSKDYNSLTEIRNSINHGGFIGNMDAKIIEDNFLKYYKSIISTIFGKDEKN